MELLRSRLILVLIGVLGAFCLPSASFKLTPNGGYDLVFAIEDTTAVTDAAQQRFIQNVKISLQVFSNQLWRATKERFFVNSVEIILPEGWTAPENTESAINTYQTSDFRISENIKYPRVENPNLCGLPGKFIELPLSFFDNANSNEYGPLWKTMMLLFARYRFGVWEEHGYVADPKFPYFHKNYSSGNWEITGCSNEELHGRFMDVNTNEECTINWESTMDSIDSCRFVPNRVSNTAKTSLMHFHWMDSVVDFCDETTHNRVAENKQNTFCNQRSIMEVIRSTPDYAAVTAPASEVNAIEFKTTVVARHPLFYILLDKGLIQGPHSVARLIPTAIGSFLQMSSFSDIVASVGSYPGDTSFVREEVPWSQLGNNLDKFLIAVGDLRTNGPLQRDFSRSLMEVSEIIKEKRHPHGAVVLVVKYGADVDDMKNLLPEAEVIVALNEQKIILCTMEVTSTEPGLHMSHLAQVATSTLGIFSTLSNPGEAPNSINNNLNYVRNRLLDITYFDEIPNTRTIIKNALTSTTGAFMPIPTGATSMEAFYSSVSKLETINFSVKIDDAIVAITPRRTVDWNEADGSAKYTYRFGFTQTQITGKNNIAITHDCITCMGTIVGRAGITNATDVNLDIVDISVTTSENVIDLGKQEPLTIYAKATKSGYAVRGLNAFATMFSSAAPVHLQLHDDGNVPDVLAGDGIFSAYFAPVLDGNYKISITFQKLSSRANSIGSKKIQESSIGRLLPIDQGGSSGCEIFNNCTMTDVNNNFMQVENVPTQFVFSNANQFLARPARVIITFLGGTSVLQWFSPRVPGFSTFTKAERYEIRSASTKDALLQNFDACDVVADDIEPKTPGLLEMHQLPIAVSTTYYAIKSIYRGIRSEVSNVRGIEIEVQTPSPETTTTPSISTTTTREPITDFTTSTSTENPEVTTPGDPDTTPIVTVTGTQSTTTTTGRPTSTDTPPPATTASATVFTPILEVVLLAIIACTLLNKQ